MLQHYFLCGNGKIQLRGGYESGREGAARGDFELSESKMKEGDEFYAKGHDVHMDLLSKEAGGESVNSGVIMMHAEDQLMAAETVRLMAEENIKLVKRIQELEAR